MNEIDEKQLAKIERFLRTKCHPAFSPERKVARDLLAVVRAQAEQIKSKDAVLEAAERELRRFRPDCHAPDCQEGVCIALRLIRTARANEPVER